MKLTINSVEDFNYEGVALGNFGNIPQQYVDVALRDPKYVVGNYIFKEAYGTAFENMTLHKKLNKWVYLKYANGRLHRYFYGESNTTKAYSTHSVL